MGLGASKAKDSARSTPKREERGSSDGDRSKTSYPSDAPVPAQRNHRASSQSSPSDASNSNSSPNSTPRGPASPGETRGFNNPQPARRDMMEGRNGTRQTRMVGAEDMNGTKEALDERPFRQERVSRIPTKAMLKPPKNPNSIIADPEDDYDLYDS